MKATGIVRRIDDLGRVVIPKEIRRTMRIREGDPLEIYTNAEGEVIFKKYSPVNELSEGATQTAEVINKLSGAPALIFDKDHIVAASGVSRKEYLNRRLSPALEDLLELRQNYEYTENETSPLYPAEGVKVPALAVTPIISNGDISGAVVILAKDENQRAKENQSTLCKAGAMLLGKQIEM